MTLRREALPPSYKKGRKENPGNYHPVSLTSVLGKILEDPFSIFQSSSEPAQFCLDDQGHLQLVSEFLPNFFSSSCTMYGCVGTAADSNIFT